MRLYKSIQDIPVSKNRKSYHAAVKFDIVSRIERQTMVWNGLMRLVVRLLCNKKYWMFLDVKSVTIK